MKHIHKTVTTHSCRPPEVSDQSSCVPRLANTFTIDPHAFVTTGTPSFSRASHVSLMERGGTSVVIPSYSRHVLSPSVCRPRDVERRFLSTPASGVPRRADSFGEEQRSPKDLLPPSVRPSVRGRAPNNTPASLSDVALASLTERESFRDKQRIGRRREPNADRRW